MILSGLMISCSSSSRLLLLARRSTTIHDKSCYHAVAVASSTTSTSFMKWIGQLNDDKNERRLVLAGRTSRRGGMRRLTSQAPVSLSTSRTIEKAAATTTTAAAGRMSTMDNHTSRRTALSSSARRHENSSSTAGESANPISSPMTARPTSSIIVKSTNSATISTTLTTTTTMIPFRYQYEQCSYRYDCSTSSSLIPFLQNKNDIRISCDNNNVLRLLDDLLYHQNNHADDHNSLFFYQYHSTHQKGQREYHQHQNYYKYNNKNWNNYSYCCRAFLSTTTIATTNDGGGRRRCYSSSFHDGNDHHYSSDTTTTSTSTATAVPPTIGKGRRSSIRRMENQWIINERSAAASSSSTRTARRVATDGEGMDDDDDNNDYYMNYIHSKNKKLQDRNNNKRTTKKNNKKKRSSKPSYRFIDMIRLRVAGGMGGNGCLSLSPIGHQQKLRPDGGNGGNGGSIILLADPHEHTLDWSHPHIEAIAGSHGGSNDQCGKNGKNKIIRIPCGVVIRRILEENEMYDPITQSYITVPLVVPASTTTTTTGSTSSNATTINRNDSVHIQQYSDQENHERDDDDDDENDNTDDDDDEMDELSVDDLAAIERLKQGYEVEIQPETKKMSKNMNKGRSRKRNQNRKKSLNTNDTDSEEDDNDMDDIDPNDDDENNFLLTNYWSINSSDYDNNNNIQPKMINRRKVVLADLDEPGSYCVVAKGGRGGLGTCIYASRHGPIPDTKLLAKNAQPYPGEVAFLELELKLIADIGLVGFPNAGKSSLLRAMSRATPEVAPYPFTTLHPMIGCIDYKDGIRIRAADIPGLIDGASTGKGKGHDFLRHIERTKALLYIVDAAGVDERNPIDDLRILIQELGSYGDGSLLHRRALVVANKVDLLNTSKRQQVVSSIKNAIKDLGIRCDQDVIGISAGVSGEGLGILAKAIRDIVLQSEHDRQLILNPGNDYVQQEQQQQHFHHGS